MNLTIFAAFYIPAVGGYCYNIHELAKRLVAEGHQVKVVTCNTEGCKGHETMDGVEIVRLPCWQLIGRTFPVPKLSVALLEAWRGKPDVVITQTRFFATSLLGAFMAFLYPAPLVHVERGTCHSVVSSRPLALAVRLYDHLFGALVVRNARVNVGVSQVAADFTGHLGGKNQRVIYNGIEA